MAQQKRSTLESIARQLGVSKMTVSNAYNRPDQLSPELRERVLGAARELGYPGPNPLASTLRRGRVGAVGMVFDEPVSFALSDPAAALIVRGLASVCETERAGLLLVPGVPGGEAGIDLVRTALVDGFIFYCDYEGEPRLKVLRDRGMPYVLVDAPAVADVSWVGIDDRGGAQLAAQHLLDLGHRSFGIVSFKLVPGEYGGPGHPGAPQHGELPRPRRATRRLPPGAGGRRHRLDLGPDPGAPSRPGGRQRRRPQRRSRAARSCRAAHSNPRHERRA